MATHNKSEIPQNIAFAKPIVQIGKQGLSEKVFLEIKKHLNKRKQIKIKCLRYFLDEREGESNKDKMKAVSCELGQKLNATTQIVGFTIILTKR